MSKHVTKVQFLSFYATTVFSPVPSTMPKIFNPRVSGRCLEGVCVTLGTVWEVLMPNQLMNSNEHCFNQLVPFLPVASDRQKSARFWGVCGVSGRCLEGFLGCLSDSGYCLGSSNAKSID